MKERVMEKQVKWETVAASELLQVSGGMRRLKRWFFALGAEPGASMFGWLRDLLGPQTIRLIHHLAMWVILMIALFHVYSCILVDHVERNGLMSSIVSGYKFVTPEEIEEARDGGPEMLEGLE